MTGAPYAVKRTKVIFMIEEAPPPKPLCFDSTAQWKDYLMYLVASGETITRRQDTGKYRGARTVTTVFDRIDYCEDCDIGGQRQRRMQREGRCIIPSDQPSKDRDMLKRLSNMLAQLRNVMPTAQVGLLPGKDGALAIMVSWTVNDEQHEVAQSFSPEEVANATDQQMADAIEVLIASVWCQVEEARGKHVTQAQALQRIRMAAALSPQHLASSTIATAARGAMNG